MALLAASPHVTKGRRAGKATCVDNLPFISPGQKLLLPDIATHSLPPGGGGWGVVRRERENLF